MGNKHSEAHFTTTDKHLIVIAGPTAVGKTDLSIKVAKAFNTGIISADSRQCYKQMSIGTAKPSPEELARVPHYFIDSFDITENINAATFETLALGYASQLFEKSNYAVLCGGTGLYIKALCEGIDEMPPTDKTIEQAIQYEFEQKGLAWLQQTTAIEDPEFYAVTEQQNPIRLIRGLSFIRSNQKSITQYKTGATKKRPFNIIKIALELPRIELYERINNRVLQMLQEGLWQEAEKLYPYKQLKNLATVGYTEIFDCLDGKITKAESIALIQQHSRNYAKRQLTWFKKDKEYAWFLPQEEKKIITEIERQISKKV